MLFMPTCGPVAVVVCDGEPLQHEGKQVVAPERVALTLELRHQAAPVVLCCVVLEGRAWSCPWCGVCVGVCVLWCTTLCAWAVSVCVVCTFCMYVCPAL
jgi:hypothetical protein